MNMNYTGAAVDLSSFVLFEASGDSDEVDYYDPTTDEIGRADDDNDDAESCSGSENCNCLDSDEDEKKEDEETEEELADDDDVYGRISYCSEDDDEEEVQKKQKSRALLVDGKAGNKESLAEMEKNRLFWEACLAS